jgi:hypothetical protein
VNFYENSLLKFKKMIGGEISSNAWNDHSDRFVTSPGTAAVSLITHPIPKPSDTQSELLIRRGLLAKCNCKEKTVCKRAAYQLEWDPLIVCWRITMSPSKWPSGRSNCPSKWQAKFSKHKHAGMFKINTMGIHPYPHSPFGAIEGRVGWI